MIKKRKKKAVKVYVTYSKWMHVVATKRKERISVYLDGKKVFECPNE